MFTLLCGINTARLQIVLKTRLINLPLLVKRSILISSLKEVRIVFNTNCQTTALKTVSPIFIA